jgi:acetyl esterase/lipase
LRNGLYRKAFRVGIRVLLALALLYSPLEMQALTEVYADGITDDYVTLYEENFDDPDNFGSTGGIAIPGPWLQEGEGNSMAKTSVSSTAPSVPNLVKIDGKDALALPVNSTGYRNLQLSYYTRASSYIGGSVIVEWSSDGGINWTTLEEFKLPPGTLEQKNSEPNQLKVQNLGSGADNNPNVKIRVRVGELMSANMYIDSVALKAQAIPGIPPAETPVPIPTPAEPKPFVVPEGVKLYEDVRIGNAGTRPIYTSIAVPKILPQAPVPVMVYIHGGGWNHGDRKQALASICNYVTKRGYIGVSLDYRLTPEAPFPAQIQDVKLAIRYLRAHAAEYHLDPSRIGVWGSSSGGHLASLLGTTGNIKSGETITLDTGHTVNVPDLAGNGGWQQYSDQVQAVVDLYGPADFTTNFANSYKSVKALLGGNDAFSVPDQARLAMPGTYASPDDPPFFIRHGDVDSTIPYTDSITFSNQLKDAGVKVVDVKIVPKQGHGFIGEAAEQASAEAWDFMDQYVKNRTATTPDDEVVYRDLAILAPSDDAVIDSSKPTVNFNSATGSSNGLFSISSGAENKKYVYFKFDVSLYSNPANRYIFNVAAKKGSSNADLELSLFGLKDTNWTESELTWSNAPVTDLTIASLSGKFTVTADKSGAPQVYSIDVSEFVRERLSASGGNIAFLLGDAASTGISLNVYSKEANGNSNPRPQLVVQEAVTPSSDHEKPSWPDGSSLKAVNIGTEFIQLSWPAASDNQGIGSYRVYRDNTLLSNVTGATYTAVGLSPSTAYSFKVEAVDQSGNTSVPLSFTRSTLTEPIIPYAIANVTASDSDGNIATNTIDNNLFTRWSAAGNSPWIQYDLGERKQISYLGIAVYKGDTRTAQLSIETSNDGLAWTTIWTGASMYRTIEMQPFDFPDTEARYVRIVGLGNSDGSAFTSLSEINIYAPFANGDTPVASIPNYTPNPPREPIPFKAPGLTEPEGTVHPVHSSPTTTGRILNVLDYNADLADNDTDDGIAIQAAINSADSGDEVYLPSGVYNLNSTLDTLVNLKLKSGVNLRGEDQSTTILKTSLNKVKNSALMKVSGQHDLSISNLTLTSTWNGVCTTDHKVNNPDAGGPDSMIIIANFGEVPSYNITVDGVTVEKYSRMGVRIDNSRDIVVRRSTFRNATDVGPGGAGYGVSIQGMAKQDRNGYENDTVWNVVEDSHFEGPYLRHGALIQFVAHNNVLRNNQFMNTKLDAIDLHGELEYLNEIYGNVIIDIPYGAAIGLGNTGGTAPSNHSKSGPRNYIHDNTIRNTREGINVTMGTPDTVIERNVIENTTHIEDAKGIQILNGPGTIIKENIIRNNTASNYWAVSLEHDPGDSKANDIGAGDPQDVQLIENSLIGNTNGIRLLAGKGIILQGNLIDSISCNYFKNDHVVVEGWPLPIIP